MVKMYFKGILLLCAYICSCRSATYPSGCTYEEYTKAVGLYSCEYGNASFPLSMSSFVDPNPQRLKIWEFSGNFQSATMFSGFGAYDVSTLNPNFKAYLEINCLTGGFITLSTTSFTDMSYIQELRIVGCGLNSGIPANSFSPFVELDFLEIEGGSIASTSATSLSGLAIKKLSNVPNPIGGISIKNCQITSGELATGFLDPITTVVSISLDNANLYNLTTGMFSQNTAVQTINLSRNKFTTVSTALFSGLNSLLSVNFTDILWDCSCENFDIQKWLSSSYIDMHGNILCNTPSSFYNMKWTQYYFNICEIKDYCFGVPGIVDFVYCYQWHQLVAHFALMIAFVVASIAVFIVCNTRRKMMQTHRHIEAKKKRVFIKIKEALLRGRDGQRPPATTHMPDFKERKWVDTTAIKYDSKIE